MDSVQEVEYISEWPPPLESTLHSVVSSQPVQEDEKKPKRCAVYSHTRQSGAAKKLKYESGRAVTSSMSNDQDSSLITSNTTMMPDLMLSRWWKKRGIDHLGSLTTFLASDSQRKVSYNPRTLLHHIAKLPEGQHMLSQRIAFLQDDLESSPSEEVSVVHFNIASCYHLLSSDLRHTCSALEHAQKALKLSEGESGEIEWLIEQLVRQKDVKEKQLQKERVYKQSSLSMPKPVQVERRCATDLSLKDFIKDFALTRTPIVITGLIDHMTTKPWTLDYIMEVIGHKMAPLKRMVEGSVEWARLESAGECSVKDFIETLDTDQDLRYLFDWSLPLNCPELVSELSIPKYFANDFLQRTPEGSLYRDSWPSLFIAPAGITSELHVDAFCSNFWMALFEGRKRWVFFPPEDTPLLYPVYSHSTDAIFQANLSSPNFSLHPLLSLTHPCECILNPGEVLYVPYGCPHRVENLEKSLAISANFVDCSNFEQVKRELSANACVDEQAKQLLSVFQDDVFNTVMNDFENTELGSGSKDSKQREIEPKFHEINFQGCSENSEQYSQTPFNNTGNKDHGILCIPWLQFKSI